VWLVRGSQEEKEGNYGRGGGGGQVWRLSYTPYWGAPTPLKRLSHSVKKRGK